MADVPQPMNKPERWGVPFDPNMTEKDVDRLLSIPPFSTMDPKRFPPRTPLRGILQFDCSIRRFKKGQIIVRQGDYGTSAFIVLAGQVQVVQEPKLPPSMLGRPEKIACRLLCDARRWQLSDLTCQAPRAWPACFARSAQPARARKEREVFGACREGKRQSWTNAYGTWTSTVRDSFASYPYFK